MSSDAKLPAANIKLDQVDEGLGGYVNNYNRWDFINPTVETTTSSDVYVATADISQEDGTSTATGQVKIGQVSFLPLQQYAGSVPSALQGLVIVRNFEATVVSEASEADSSASNSVTYSATIGMFNNSKWSSCSGDSCYDFYSISPDNPIQSAIDLNNPDYALQQALITEWYSYTNFDIDNVTDTSGGGSEALVSIDAVLKISSVYAGEIRQKTNGQHDVVIVSQEGLQKLWLGTFNTSVVQHV